MAVLTNGTWVLVADSEKALFLVNTLDEINPGFEVVRQKKQDNPRDIEQSANRPGRRPDTGHGHRSAMDDTDWHELAKERFAEDLAEKLYQYAHRGEFKRIVLVAPAGVIGDMRPKLHKEVRDKVVGEVVKDYTNHPLDKVEKLLKEELDRNL